MPSAFTFQLSAFHSMRDKLSHIVLVISRGEAVRNFLYSDTLSCLKAKARVTVLTVVVDDDLAASWVSIASRVVMINCPRCRPSVLSAASDRPRWLTLETI